MEHFKEEKFRVNAPKIRKSIIFIIYLVSDQSLLELNESLASQPLLPTQPQSTT